MLEAGRIFDDAVRRGGLADHATDGMRQRFHDLLATFNANGAIPESGRGAAVADLELLVTHRLMIERDWQRHPEIAAQEIRRPIFIIGNPRTGTTLLQCLLAEDATNQILRYWQSHFPSPPPNTDPGSVQGRIANTDALIAELLKAAPGMLPCHPYLDQGGLAELEDEELFTLDFQSAFPFHFLHVPTMPVGATPRDPRAAFEFHKRMLQHYQWGGEPKRWVCKGTTHQFLLQPLLEVYPDAICVWPHRDPSEFLGSTLEMIAILYGPLTSRDVTPDARAFLAEIKAGYDAILDSPVIEDPRLHHMRFVDLAEDPVGSLRRFYDRYQIAFVPEFESSITSWLSDPAHDAHRHGRFRYSVEDFGFAPEEVRAMFAGYCERFEV